MRKQLFIMIGAAGSGKSTLARAYAENLEGSTAIVSRDEIRFSMVKEDEPYFSKEKEVYQKYVRTIKESLKDYDNVICDATHTHRDARKRLFEELGDSINDVELIAIYVKPELETVLEQNAQREGRERVPESVVIRMYEQIQAPTLKEGFERIIYER